MDAPTIAAELDAALDAATATATQAYCQAIATRQQAERAQMLTTRVLALQRLLATYPGERHKHHDRVSRLLTLNSDTQLEMRR